MTQSRTSYKRWIWLWPRLYTSVRHRRLQRNSGLHYREPLGLLQHLRSLRTGNQQHICQGCSAAPHPGGRTQCPAYSQICFNCQKIGHLGKVSRSRPWQHVLPTNAVQRIPHPGQRGLSTSNADTTRPELDNMKHVASSDPIASPFIRLDVIAANGSCNTKALSDSGAVISAAWKTTLSSLNLPLSYPPRWFLKQ